MKQRAAVLIGSCAGLASTAALAATPEDGNRATMLSIILVAGVMILAVKLAIALAKRKLEKDLQADLQSAQDKSERPEE